MRPGDRGVTRREFLRTGGAAATGLTIGSFRPVGAEPRSRANHCIILFLVGGPSQLETFDPKPEAPAEVRGPFQPIRTRVPGILVSEHLPHTARLMDRISLVRAVHHDAQPIHETGQQLLQTGRLSHGGVEHPHVGPILSHALGQRDLAAPASVVVPTPIGNTGVAISHGQSAGWLGSKHSPVFLELVESQESWRGEERYGPSPFGRACLQARQLVEAGVRLVTVNMFDTVFNEITWDCHADGGSLASTFDDYKTTLCPMFDQAYSALLEDLSQRGLLGETLVVAMGEFGRTPGALNNMAGRDHYNKCFPAMFAVAGVKAGAILGRTDADGLKCLETGWHRKEQPRIENVVATMYSALGIDWTKEIRNTPSGRTYPLVDQLGPNGFIPTDEIASIYG